MSIPLKLFLAISLEVFSEMSALRLTSIDVLSEQNKMADSVDISFVDKK